MFRTINAQAIAHVEPHPAAGIPAQHFAGLVGRYPNLSEVELARMINLYRELSALDLALMIADESLGPKVDRFFTDHRSKLRTPFRQYAVLAAIGILGLAVTIWTVAFHV
jgi:hypothetical protein